MVKKKLLETIFTGRTKPQFYQETINKGLNVLYFLKYIKSYEDGMKTEKKYIINCSGKMWNISHDKRLYMQSITLVRVHSHPA